MATYPSYTGTNLGYIYDRDRNALLSDFLVYLPISPPAPDYGSKTVFKTKVTKTEALDGIEKRKPKGLNSVYAEMSLNYSNLSNGELGFIVNKLEQAVASTGDGEQTVTIYNSGYNRLLYETYPTGMSMYPESISGLLVTNYNINAKDRGLYDLNVTLVNNQYSSFLDYRGIYTRQSAIETWNTGMNFVEHDIVYYPIFEDKRNNFFYCLSGHNASTWAQAPNQDASIWTQSFYFKPDYSVSTSHDHGQSMIDNTKGFINRIKINKNSNKVKFNLSFEGRSNKESLAMLHFLENKMGYRAFDMNISGAYKTKKVFYAPSWTHSQVFYDSNNIEVEMEEDVKGMATKELNVENYWNIPA